MVGKGKGHNCHSSGRGFNSAYTIKAKGARKNPTGPDGKIMMCSICGSEDHFRAQCSRGPGQSRTMLVLGEQPEAAVPTTVSPNAGPMSHYFEEFGLVCDGTEAAQDLDEGRHYTARR